VVVVIVSSLPSWSSPSPSLSSESRITITSFPSSCFSTSRRGAAEATEEEGAGISLVSPALDVEGCAVLLMLVLLIALGARAWHLFGVCGGRMCIDWCE
jgi:hypothetical protein